MVKIVRDLKFRAGARATELLRLVRLPPLRQEDEEQVLAEEPRRLRPREEEQPQVRLLPGRN